MEATAPTTVLPTELRLIGDLTVFGSARIACELRGKVHVRDHLEIFKEARIDGELRSGSLRIEPGARIKALLLIGKAATHPTAPVLSVGMGDGLGDLLRRFFSLFGFRMRMGGVR
ncbi:Polymer-forming protein [Verrucomicrobium sp. GAS474]|uniref:bactofilin family protein n=1 Tax=Verrucomicrobium sp. GAS474 TaxID=1882831 RepID=UPI00087BB0B7|nr:polymer-forming cytoskeletal protein [Verrucomicrobium sp. GAS474]SDU23652.1 Polymer-forming protein [Verrucomicrobium sp. GAS474]